MQTERHHTHWNVYKMHAKQHIQTHCGCSTRFQLHTFPAPGVSCCGFALAFICQAASTKHCGCSSRLGPFSALGVSCCCVVLVLRWMSSAHNIDDRHLMLHASRETPRTQGCVQNACQATIQNHCCCSSRFELTTILAPA